MDRKKWILFAGILVAVGVAVAAVLMFRPGPAAEEAAEPQLIEAELGDGQAQGDEAKGKPENFVHGEYDPQYDEGKGLESGLPAEAAAGWAERFAEVWMTYDSEMSVADRTAQLATVIPNPEDWAEKTPAIHKYDPRQYGNPTWRTVASLTAPPEAVPEMGYSIDGESTVPVNISFIAYFTAGGGQDRGSVTTTNNWSFVFNAASELVELIEPELKPN